VGRFGDDAQKSKATRPSVRAETTVETVQPKREFSLESDIVAPAAKLWQPDHCKSAAGIRLTLGKNQILKPDYVASIPPTLYILKSRVKSGEAVVTETETPFGSAPRRLNRTRILPSTAFRQAQGRLLHHDAGSFRSGRPFGPGSRTALALLKESAVNAHPHQP